MTDYRVRVGKCNFAHFDRDLFLTRLLYSIVWTQNKCEIGRWRLLVILYDPPKTAKFKCHLIFNIFLQTRCKTPTWICFQNGAEVTTQTDLYPNFDDKSGHTDTGESDDTRFSRGSGEEYLELPRTWVDPVLAKMLLCKSSFFNGYPKLPGRKWITYFGKSKSL